VVSIIVPARNEKFLQQTINSIIANATGEYEVLVHLDGYWPLPPLDDHPNVNLVHSSTSIGMREAINGLVRIAKGKYILKCDAHCAFAQGFDEALRSACDGHSVVIPRRYSLNVDTWGIDNNGKVRDAHYLSHPTAFGDDTYLGFGMHVKDWPERGEERKDFVIDEDMITQGSCWLMKKDYFRPLSSIGYGTFIQESQEICLRAWLSGGKVLVNKNTWYAHLWKGKTHGRMYPLSREESKRGEIYSADFWYNNRGKKELGLIHDFEWLVDKFWPIPTWHDDWRSLKINFPAINLEPTKPTLMVTTEVKNTMSPKFINRDSTVNYILNKFNINIKLKPDLPIELNYNRSQWGKLFNELGFTSGAEIGVYGGEYSENLCRDNPGVKHYGIDPWLAYPEYVSHRIQQGLCSAEEEARERLKKYNCELIKEFSMDAVKRFKDNSLDYVYIDGNHDFQNATNDIVEWEKKVRPGGIVAGHDYDKHAFRSRCHVKQVVKAYTEAIGVYPWFITSKECRTKDTHGNSCTSWFWVKA